MENTCLKHDLRPNHSVMVNYLVPEYIYLQNEILLMIPRAKKREENIFFRETTHNFKTDQNQKQYHQSICSSFVHISF